MAAGYEPFHLIDMAVTAAAQLSGSAANTAMRGSGCLPPDWDLQGSSLPSAALHSRMLHAFDLSYSTAGTAKPRVDKVVPEFVNYFGWCTWDAFYSTVSAEG